MRRILGFGLTLLVGTACVRLAFWQLQRLAERRTANRVAQAGRALPPLRLDSTGAHPVAERRAIAVGEYDEARELILRGRMVREVPAVVVVTPLRIRGSDTALLVNRGYVPAPDAATPRPELSYAEPGARTVTGVLLPVPDAGDGAPALRGGRETWYRLDLTALRARLPYPVFDTYLLAQSESGDAGQPPRGGAYPIRAEPPALDSGPHLSYAIQWFGIGAAAVAFGVVFVLRTGQRGRGAPGP